MKKYLSILSAVALLLSGCAKEQNGPGAVNDGDMIDVNITAGTAELTKATIDGDGAAAFVTRWIMEVREASGAVYAYKEATEAAGTLQHTFNIKLFKNQQYTFAFWADNGGEYYDASDLSAVKYADGKAVVAGVDAKDAFSAAETITFTQSISKTITLYRPFAQLNVITTDLAALRADVASAEMYNSFKPKNFKTTITVPTQFNVLTGAASGETELILAADEFYGKTPYSYEDAQEQATMFMAYIFATRDEKDVRNINFKFDVDSQTGNNTFDFTDVPFQRNYRTNILGNFLSGDAEWTVIIDPDWDGEYDFPPYEAGSIAAANASLLAGETNISITDPSDYADVSLVIPAAVNDKDLIIAVAEKADMELDIDASYSTPKSISLSAVKAKSINIDAPASHVELTAGEYKTVDAATSATTLVVGKNTKITEKLTIHEGNAVIDGSVETFANETGATLVWNVANTAELANAVKFAGAADEIKLAAGNYTMPTAISTSGLKITGEGGVVIECPKETVTITSDSVTLEDLTIKCNPLNTVNSGALNISKSAKLENITFTQSSNRIVVVGGTGTVDFNGCRFENGKGRGIMVWGGSPKINVDGCYFDNTYPFNVDGGSPEFTFTASQLNGWTSYGGTTTASFEGCDFGESTSGYKYCRPYRNTTFTNCNFCEGYNVDFGAAGIEIDMNGCKLNGQPMTVDILDTSDLSNSGILRIDGVEVYPFYSKDSNGNYHVANARALFAIAADMNKSLDKFTSKTIFLDADIDLENEAWTPIQGSQSGDYAITFNGQGHKISNVVVSDVPEDGGAGFFGHWAGTITNFDLDGVRIENTINWSGALCGYFSTGTISNVNVSNVVISNLNEEKCKRNGGLCGFVNASTDFSNVAVCGVAITGTEQLGGFIGSLQADGAATYNFTDCSVSDVQVEKVGNKEVTSFGTKTGGHATAAVINGNIAVSGTNTLPEGSPEDGWGANSL